MAQNELRKPTPCCVGHSLPALLTSHLVNGPEEVKLANPMLCGPQSSSPFSHKLPWQPCNKVSILTVDDAGDAPPHFPPLSQANEMKTQYSCHHPARNLV